MKGKVKRGTQTTQANDKEPADSVWKTDCLEQCYQSFGVLSAMQLLPERTELEGAVLKFPISSD